MRVLIGYSACQITREAFEAQGHIAYTCDLLPARGSQEWHIQGNVWDALRDWWDFAVLHPMCTYLTVSAAWAYGDGPYHQRVKPGTLVGAERRAARADAIANFRALLDLPFPVACENPSPSFLSTAIRQADQVIQPWMFGDDASKSTGLWLTRGTPPLVSRKSDHVPGRIVGEDKRGRTIVRWSNQTDSGQNKLTPSDDRWLERSKTYPGIAAAMGAQWGAWLKTRY